VAHIRQVADARAQELGWIRDRKASKLNDGRVIYYDKSENLYYSLDTQHGRFEVTNARGKHQGEVNFELEPIKNSLDESGGHDIRLK
jgi:hypothetical protein